MKPEYDDDDFCECAICGSIEHSTYDCPDYESENPNDND